MEILTSFIIPFVILLTVVVFIHEYGHYYFAKKYGVGVTDFSIGFTKELSFNELLETYPKLLKGEFFGRAIVNPNK